jgi:hypothetical protein
MTTPSFSSETYNPDRLIGGDQKLITRDITLTDIGTTGALTRGTVLGKVTADGKYGISLTASADGSQTPRAILVKDADPGGGDVTASIYDEGEFNQDTLVYGTGHDADSVREDLRAVSIHLKEPVSV